MPRKAKKPTTSVMVVTKGPDETGGIDPKSRQHQRNDDAAERGRGQHADHRKPDHHSEVGDLEPRRPPPHP